MRDIKFRAWDVKNERMVYEPYYFDVYHYSDENRVNKETHLYYEDWRDLEDGRGYECELMQYTGLKDKNGKEIYEGDIINVENCELVDYHETDHGVVEKYEDSKGKVHYAAASFCFDGHSAGDLPLETFDFERMEVIGNIYENPELTLQATPPVHNPDDK